MIKHTFLLFVLSFFLLVSSYAADQKTLLFVSQVDGTNLPIFELKSTGEIITTGQILNLGSLSRGIGVSPDQKYIWTNYYDTTFFGLKQWTVTSFGQVSATGRTVSLLSGSGVSNIKFTPNGEMLLLSAISAQLIFHTYPDGSIISTGNGYSSSLNISPRGDINIVRINGFRKVDKINYGTYSVSSLQQFSRPGTIIEEVVYTPNGSYAGMQITGGSNDDIEIYPVLSDGSFDTTKVQVFELGILSDYLAIKNNGTHIYAGSVSPEGIIRLDWFSQDTPFIDSGSLTPVSNPWHIKVSPDDHFLVVVSQVNPVPTKQYLRTFFIQADGSLVDTGYSFPFTDMFGDFVADLQFVYPPAPTDIPPEFWGKLE